MLHTGYLFGQDSNAPKAADGRLCSPQGALFGIGGALRVHLWKHLRTGFEGFVSTMPSAMTDCRDVLKNGSYVRVGCGGVLADCCWRLDKAWPYIGGVIGGGSMKKLYVPAQDNVVQPTDPSNAADTTATIYNSSFVKTPFFFLDPYVGMEIGLTNHIALLIRIDYMLPFNIHNKGLSEVGQQVKWDHFVTPSGPRLYVGVMFGKLKKK